MPYGPWEEAVSTYGAWVDMGAPSGAGFHDSRLYCELLRRFNQRQGSILQTKTTWAHVGVDPVDQRLATITMGNNNPWQVYWVLLKDVWDRMTALINASNVDPATCKRWTWKDAGDILAAFNAIDGTFETFTPSKHPADWHRIITGLRSVLDMMTHRVAAAWPATTVWARLHDIDPDDAYNIASSFYGASNDVAGGGGELLTSPNRVAFYLHTANQWKGLDRASYDKYQDGLSADEIFDLVHASFASESALDIACDAQSSGLIQSISGKHSEVWSGTDWDSTFVSTGWQVREKYKALKRVRLWMMDGVTEALASPIAAGESFTFGFALESRESFFGTTQTADATVTPETAAVEFDSATVSNTEEFEFEAVLVDPITADANPLDTGASTPCGLEWPLHVTPQGGYGANVSLTWDDQEAAVNILSNADSETQVAYIDACGKLWPEAEE